MRTGVVERSRTRVRSVPSGNVNLSLSKETTTFTVKGAAETTETGMAAVREVMTTALAVGGTSFDSLYVNVNGESGYFDRSLAVYGQADRPCPRCGTPVRRDPFMNRSAYTCPRCQPRPRNGRW